MKRVFVISGAVALLVDLTSYYTRINSSLLGEASLAVGGIALVTLGLIRKSRKDRVSWEVQQPQTTYHTIPKVLPAPIDQRMSSKRILRTVPDENAFYFYKMLHYYLDVKAKNLAEFFEKLKTIDIDSIKFHVSRGDFREWFRTTLGDDDLASQVSILGEKVAHSSDEELRTRVANMVQSRLNALNQM
jgi:hypothetical protein